MKTKDTVFAALSDPRTEDGFVSGENLAERCGISRQAVWKAVNVLRHQGARIEAVTNRGYHLEGTGGMLTDKTVGALLLPELGARVHVYATIDSTNTEAKRQCAEARDVRSLDRTVIIASQQTAGRGRLGRSFYSPAGSGLYLSVIYAPENGITSPAQLTASAAVAVCRTLESVYGEQSRIKWVNDVFIRKKKVCGILTEGVTNFETGRIDCAIVGIGINILPGSFPPEIADVAGAVLENPEGDTKRSALAAGVVNNVLGIYTAGPEGRAAAMEEYRQRSLLTGMTVTVCPVIGNQEGNYEALVQGVTDDAKLIVQTADGCTKILESGEVSIRSRSLTLR